MRLTKQTSYALRILLHCALRPEAQLKAADIAKAYNITEFNVLKIIPLLVHGGFVKTTRGRRGGLRLARPACRDPHRRRGAPDRGDAYPGGLLRPAARGVPDPARPRRSTVSSTPPSAPSSRCSTSTRCRISSRRARPRTKGGRRHVLPRRRPFGPGRRRPAELTLRLTVSRGRRAAATSAAIVSSNSGRPPKLHAERRKRVAFA